VQFNSTMPITLTTATLRAQGAAAGRKLESCNTSEVATCFANMINGGDIDLVPGTMSSWDGLYTPQLFLLNKYASIACNEDGGACVWQGAATRGVVMIDTNGGTTTLRSITIKDGDASSGGGLFVWSSNVDLILIDFIDNVASSGGAIFVSAGSSTVNLQGCSLAGNIASTGPDVYNNAKTVVISGWCPEGEDKPIRPSPPFVPSLH